ncbi:hypothetical protein [Pseudomonas sp. CCI2.4]|uniref:hypothetical protein n=1 Tax=Pseudomonas sp. CCI2.4 TaxID=3048617 RepID=UPI002B23C83F|nr:hypothetical protein [Pseudomonas sp. CCI2.4]MEB0129721.1 hypothetical protein [Pseudomonas sp. CCI2.4]
MSKLSKFKYNITTAEASLLLARLISEDVSDTDIENLLTSHWIDGYYACQCTIVKVDFFIEGEQHKNYIDLGIYAVQITEDVGTCFGLPYPCGSVFLDGTKNVFALTDKDGALYVLRDTETGQYLSQDADSVFFTDLVIEADSVYKLAKLANTDEPAPEFDIELRPNKWCVGDEKYYPFFPDGWQSKSTLQVTAMQTNLEVSPLRSSRTLLTLIAALCKGANIDRNQRGASQRIKELTEQVGVPVNDETIRTVLSGISDALESRSK